MKSSIHTLTCSTFCLLLVFSLFLTAGCGADAGAADAAEAVRAIEPARTAKPADDRLAIALPVQNEKHPEGGKEMPFIEDAPEIVPTKAEKEAQMILFSRTLTEPIWPNTNPLDNERVTKLTGWGAQNQYVTLNFAVFPLSDLKNLKVRISDCSVEPELRIVQYWDIIYPKYNSYASNPKTKLWRRMPEFLAPFSQCDAPEGEPQRFYLTFKLPADGTAAVNGEIVVYHDDYEQALTLPFQIEVLPFELKQDPKKNYSSYYYHVRTPGHWFYEQNKNNTELLHQAQLNEFKRMIEYGFTRPPMFNLTLSKLPNVKEDAYMIPSFDTVLPELREAGFPPDAPIAVPGCSAMYLYQKFTGLKLKSFHMENIECDKIPEELYELMGLALQRFLKYAEEHNYPPIIFNPIDEPSPITFPYVKRIYEIFKAQGVTTFQTSPPDSFKEISHLFDIYNYGKFHVPYERAVSGDKLEYWCYPNDAAFQIKDPNIMCHGGRMFYGLGFWRSGFHCITPWIWRTMEAERLCNAGGNLLLPDGSLLMTTYWETFRLGVDDLRYIYTLEDAVMKRQNPASEADRAVIAEAMQVLQDTWNAIYPQPAYLRDNLIHHDELDAIRARLAVTLLKVLPVAETSPEVTAPSVIVDTKGKHTPNAENADRTSVIELPLQKWTAGTKEVAITENGKQIDVTVSVNHQQDGETADGKYPVGWPRITKHFSRGTDLNKYGSLVFDITAQSDRNIEDDYKWIIYVTLKCRSGKESQIAATYSLEPGVKHTLSLPLTGFSNLTKEELASPSLLHIFIAEIDFPHGCTAQMNFENIRFVGFNRPTIVRMDTPSSIALPLNSFSCPAVLGGIGENESFPMLCELTDAQGNIAATAKGVGTNNKAFCSFDANNLTPGDYSLRMKILDKDGEVLSGMEKPLRIFNGPAKTE